MIFDVKVCTTLYICITLWNNMSYLYCLCQKINFLFQSIKMRRKIFWILGVILIIALSIIAFFVLANYSEGYRTGNIMKISKKGVIFKTWEGQLNVGNMQMITAAANGTPGSIWDFSVTDPSVLTQIEKAVDDGEQVKVYYHEKYYQFSWRGDTKYIVYKVEEIDRPAQPLRSTENQSPASVNTPPKPVY